MSSKDFKLASIVIETFNLTQSNLKNVAHQILDIFCFITPPILDAFQLTKNHFKGLRKSFKIMY